MSFPERGPEQRILNSNTEAFSDVTPEQKLAFAYTEIAQNSFEIARRLGAMAAISKLPDRIVSNRLHTVTDLYRSQLSETYMSVTRQSMEVAVKLGRAAIIDDEKVENTEEGEVIELPLQRISLEDYASLTKRECEILSLVSTGMSNLAMARELWVTEQTVKFHLYNIYRKLDIHNRTEATRYYLNLVNGQDYNAEQLHSILEAKSESTRRLPNSLTKGALDFIKTKIGEHTTYKEIGKQVYSDRAETIQKKGARANVLMNSKPFRKLLNEEGIWLEKILASEVEGFKHLDGRIIVIIPREIEK